MLSPWLGWAGVLVFGAVLPVGLVTALPSAEAGRLVRSSARLRERWYGTRLVLMPSAFDTSTDAMVAAVRRFSDVPVVAG